MGHCDSQRLEEIILQQVWSSVTVPSSTAFLLGLLGTAILSCGHQSSEFQNFKVIPNKASLNRVSGLLSPAN